MKSKVPNSVRRQGNCPYRKKLVSACVGSAFAWTLTIPAAFAQASPADQAAPSAPSTTGTNEADIQTLDSVTVTARREKEKSQDVPLAITSFTNQQLQDADVKSLNDLARLTPGLTIDDNGSQAGLSPTIRGMANFSGTGDPNVAVFLDGIYLSNNNAISLGLFDFERIEVVKGPVSALYGRNAFAGAINYVSVIPTDTFSANITSNLGEYDRTGLQAEISGAINPGILKARVAVNFDRFGGSYEDDANGQRAGGYEKRDGQVGFVLTPGGPAGALSFTGNLYQGYDSFENPALYSVTNNCGAPVPGFSPYAGTPQGAYSHYCGQIHTTDTVQVANLSGSGSSGNNRHDTAGSLKANLDVGFGDISALYGFNKVTSRAFTDFTGLRDGIPYFVNTGGTVDLPEIFGYDANNIDNSIEVRFASKQNQPFRYSLGGYYFDQRSISTTLIGIDGSPLLPGQTIAGALAGIDDLFLTGKGQYANNYTLESNTDDLTSAFGSADLDVLPGLTLSGEYRHSVENKSELVERNAFTGNTSDPFGGASTANFPFDNYRASATYHISPSSMVYFSAADGTKAGGFNGEATIPSEVSYQPETNTTYEFGSKNSLLNNTLQLNAAVFHINSQNLQIYGASADPKNPGLVIKNFGGTTNTGFELEAVWIAARGLTLTAGIGYADPTFDSGTYDYSDAATCASIKSCAGRVVTLQSPSGPKQAVNLSGLRPPLASKVNFSTSAQYFHRVSDFWNGFGRADLRYESSQVANGDLLNLANWGPRTTVNLRAGVENANYRITFYIDNVTNDVTPETANYNVRLNDFTGNIVAGLPQGRTFGVLLSYMY